MSVNAAEESAVGHYLARGLTKDVACGIVAVLVAESNLVPASQGVQASEHGGALNPAGAYGVASWNGPRQAKLSAFAAKYGRAPSDLLTQLDFVLTEAANDYPTVWKAFTDPAATFTSVVTVMVDDYEIPADKPAEIARALAIAKDLVAATITPSSAAASVPAAPIAAPPAPAPTAPSADAKRVAFIVALLGLMADYGATFS